jgi:hypothetical protein
MRQWQASSLYNAGCATRCFASSTLGTVHRASDCEPWPCIQASTKCIPPRKLLSIQAAFVVYGGYIMSFCLFELLVERLLMFKQAHAVITLAAVLRSKVFGTIRQ